MFLIEQKYGNDGYATWFKLLESLASTDNHFLDLSRPMDLMYMAAKCRVQDEVLKSILDDLSSIGEIDSELWRIGVVWSTKFVESIEDAYRKRNNKIQTYEDLRRSLEGNGRLKGAGNPEKGAGSTQSKVKESKVKESKVDFVAPDSDEPAPEKPHFNFKKALISMGVSADISVQFMHVRKKKRATDSEIAFKAIEREIVASGRSPDECITLAVERSWPTFKVEWMQNATKNTQNGFTAQQSTNSNLKGPTMGQRMEEAKRRAAEGLMQQGNSGPVDNDNSFEDYTVVK
jgi:hypothetical protein